MATEFLLRMTQFHDLLSTHSWSPVKSAHASLQTILSHLDFIAPKSQALVLDCGILHH